MSANGRLKELDALRGLAALTVVFGHFAAAFLEFPNVRDAKSMAVYFVGNGRAAVVLFFILSGFVLSIPAIQNKSQSYPVFITRRITRIYLPYLAGLSLAVLGVHFLYGHLPLTPWTNGPWQRPVQWPLVWQHVLFIGSYICGEYNTAFWSLVIEMRVSLVFPLLCLLVLRLPWRMALLTAWLVACAASLLGIILPHTPMPQATFHFTLQFDDMLGSIYYANLFVVGILLARHRDRLTQWAGGLSRGAALAMFLGSILLYIYGNLAVACFCRVAFRGMTTLPSILGGCTGDWPCAIGATGIILLALGRRSFSNAMLSSPCQFLGKISYSLYLLHATILFALLHLCYGKLATRLPVPVLFGVYLGSVLLCSTVFYQLVEAPCMALGRNVSDRLKRLQVEKVSG